MTATVRRNVELTAEQADLIDRKVAEGEFASAAEVIEAGLAALADQDLAIERRLGEDVVPVVRK